MLVSVTAREGAWARGAGAACQCNGIILTCGMLQLWWLSQHSTAQCSTSLLTDSRPWYSIIFKAHADADMPDGRRCLEAKDLNVQASTHLCLPCNMVLSAAQHVCAVCKCWPYLLAGLPKVCHMASACHDALCTPLQINHLCIPCSLMPLPAQRRVQAHGLAH